MNYTKTLEKALFCLKDLQLDKALKLLFELLAEHPKDLDIIQRVYTIESKRSDPSGLQKLFKHLLSFYSHNTEIHALIVILFQSLSEKSAFVPILDFNQNLNLLQHLSRSHLHAETDLLAAKIKSSYPEKTATAQSLLLYYEALIAKKRFIKAREELQYLCLFYAELSIGRSAKNLLSLVNKKIIH